MGTTTSNPLLEGGTAGQGFNALPELPTFNEGGLAGGLDGTGSAGGTGGTGGQQGSGRFQVLGPNGQPTGAIVRPDETGNLPDGALQPGETLGPEIPLSEFGGGGSKSPTTGTPSSSVTSGVGATGVGFGYPLDIGLQPGTVQTVQTAVQNTIDAATNRAKGWWDTLENWIGRGLLIFLGLVLLAIALWRMLAPDSGGKAIARALEGLKLKSR